jgi:HAD superfamily hydrolase (TIGR01509 family)
MPIQWIIFDAMGVIFVVGDDINKLLVPFLQQKNPAITKDQVNLAYSKASIGQISTRSFWRELGFENEYPKIEIDYLDTFITLDPEFIPLAEQLGKQYSLGILSNDLDDWSKFLRRKFDLDRLFKAIVVSGEVGTDKPNKPIFKILLDQTQSPASDCVFIDNQPENLETAAAIGFKTIKFDRDTTDNPFIADFTISRLNELPDIIKKLS